MAKCDRPLAGGDWESSVRPGGVSTWANWLRGFQRNVRRRHRGFWSSSSPLPRGAVANVRRRYVSSKHRMIRKRHAPNGCFSHQTENARQKNEEWDWSSSFFCLAFFRLVGLGARNDGGTGPPATAYCVVLLAQCSTSIKSQCGQRRI